MLNSNFYKSKKFHVEMGMDCGLCLRNSGCDQRIGIGRVDHFWPIVCSFNSTEASISLALCLLKMRMSCMKIFIN